MEGGVLNHHVLYVSSSWVPLSLLPSILPCLFSSVSVFLHNRAGQGSAWQQCHVRAPCVPCVDSFHLLFLLSTSRLPPARSV